MTELTQKQKDDFWRDGVLLVENAVTDQQLKNLREVFNTWVEESRSHDSDYGETLDGRPVLTCSPVIAHKFRAYGACNRLKRFQKFMPM